MNNLIAKFCYYSFGVKFPFLLLYALPLLIFYDLFSRLIKNKYFKIFLVLIPPTVIFVRLLRNDPFFLSDDFAHLKLASEYSYLQIAHIALTEGIWVGHRIFLAFWLFKAIFDLFQTNVQAYLLVNFILHIINLIVFYKILEKLKKGTFVSILVSFILGTFYLTWISNIHELLGGTFLLLGLYCWLKYLKKELGIWFSITFYLLAIFSKEITFLMVPSLLLVSVYYHFNIKKLKTGEISKGLAPLIVLFITHLLVYARGFLSYSDLPQDGGYKIVFSLSLLTQNFTTYFSMLIPIINNSFIRLLLFVLIFVGLDVWKKKPLTTPFLASSFLFLIPPSLFANRISNYYTYLPSFFLFMGIAVFFWECSRFKILSNRLFVTVFLIVTLFYVFPTNKIFMDNCFLIQFPWKKTYSEAFYSITDKLESRWLKGELTPGKEIFLNDAEKTEDMQALYETGAVHLFLKDKKAWDLRFVYNKGRETLEISTK